jgi:hypothetical protein
MPVAVPRFYLEPESAAYLDRLLRCGTISAIANHHLGKWPPWHEAQLVNPVANDVRGGIGAATLLCLSAQQHERRTLEVEEAEVVLLCAHQYYNALLEHSPPCPELFGAGSSPVSRVARLKQLTTSSAAWASERPHVFIGEVEYSAWAYRQNGSPFGQPPPPFVIQANPSHFPFGVARQHAVIPFMPNVDLMTSAVRARADNRTGGDNLARRSNELLLFFRGTLDYGTSRSRLLPLAQYQHQPHEDHRLPDVIFDARESKNMTGDWAIRPRLSNIAERELGYVEALERTTFCLTPSGHT